jgi:hypothetical protein
VALTEDNNIAQLAARPLPVLPLAALDRLARLHAENGEASHVARLLRNAIHAASLFMLMGSCVLLLGGGGAIGRNFSWAVLVLIGVVGLIHSYIRTNAARRAPASQAARNLRAIFFYLGIAWGAGAFLALPSALPASEAILFAVAPALLLALLLKDGACLAAFHAPAGALTIGAAFIRAWPDAGLDALAILALQWGLFGLLAVRRRNPLPPGLALR